MSLIFLHAILSVFFFKSANDTSTTLPLILSVEIFVPAVLLIQVFPKD